VKFHQVVHVSPAWLA